MLTISTDKQVITPFCPLSDNQNAPRFNIQVVEIEMTLAVRENGITMIFKIHYTPSAAYNYRA
ncbi:hypothetical protein AXK12_00620 [Cephaloticoccus capnophilus]|uniref:Uncharacterized protein n=1 Tax=Cephaloticoccus capnophilus TaxID=1548208 RepID=A0A139SH60_9BACT|nr:hypothetical protein AXK12_00620 [Cephaloticoccus capnophilus]